MHVDRPGQRDPVDDQFLIVGTIGGDAGQGHPDDRNETDDETKSNHRLTQEDSERN